MVITAFFFCDCEAADGQAILVAPYEAGDSEFIFSAVYEIDLHWEVDNLIGKKKIWSAFERLDTACGTSRSLR